MSLDEVVTTEMVHAVTTCLEGRARHIATYLNHRYAGLRRADARRETGISGPSGDWFEKLLPALQKRFDLPELPSRREIHTDYKEASRVARHRRWHVDRGITKPECDLCAAADNDALNTSGGAS